MLAGEDAGAQRGALGAHFRSRIPALLDAWRLAIAADPDLTTGDSLPRAQLVDHLPPWLEGLATALGAAPGSAEARRRRFDETRDAKAHGLQRWQQGYDLHEVTREWGALHLCLVTELDRYFADHPTAPEVQAEARLTLAWFISDSASESAAQYFRLERLEAAGAVRDLEAALEDIRDLERRRAELWQQAAHDLRGNLGVVSNVAQGLALGDLPEAAARNLSRSCCRTTSVRCTTCSTTSPTWPACMPDRKCAGSRPSTPPTCCAASATTSGRWPRRRSCT